MYVAYRIVEKSNQHTAINEHLAMPFGKYKGQEIGKITDRDYLSWCLKNMTTLKEKFQEAIYKRIQEL